MLFFPWRPENNRLILLFMSGGMRFWWACCKRVFSLFIFFFLLGCIFIYQNAYCHNAYSWGFNRRFVCTLKIRNSQFQRQSSPVRTNIQLGVKQIIISDIRYGRYNFVSIVFIWYLFIKGGYFEWAMKHLSIFLYVQLTTTFKQYLCFKIIFGKQIISGNRHDLKKGNFLFNK